MEEAADLILEAQAADSDSQPTRLIISSGNTSLDCSSDGTGLALHIESWERKIMSQESQKHRPSMPQSRLKGKLKNLDQIRKFFLRDRFSKLLRMVLSTSYNNFQLILRNRLSRNLG